MTLTKSKAVYLSISSLMVIVGILFSGPVGLIITRTFGGQSTWEGAEVFAGNYSAIEALPFAFGFLLILGFMFFFSCLIGAGKEGQQPLEVMGVVLAGIFGSLVCLNYTIQVAYIPILVDENASILAFLAMTNPASLPWAIEMFGYCILGIATVFAAPLFSNRGLQAIIRWLLVLNGVLSVGGAVMFTVNSAETVSGFGIVGYVFWNALIVVIMLLVIIEFRFGRRSKAS